MIWPNLPSAIRQKIHPVLRDAQTNERQNQQDQKQEPVTPSEEHILNEGDDENASSAASPNKIDIFV